MISHFLGVSQTLILKGGHTGSIFSKILGNSHWLSPESGFSQDASTPLLPKLWGKSLFATQEWGGGGNSPIHELYGYVPNYAPFVVSSLSQAKEEHSHFDNCCLEQGRKFSLLGKSWECQRLGTLPPQSTTRCATTQRHAGYYRQENIYMYPEGHHSHITTKSARPGLPLKQEQNS